MKSRLLFELCAESVQAAQIAEAGGVGRIELCSQLIIGGVTPDTSLICNAVRAVNIPVHVLIRPRGGDFIYSNQEFTLIRRQILESKMAGAAGVAIGILLPNGGIDLERTREIAELASPLKVTFHRAFDEVHNQQEALEDVIKTGADCLLTSGGKANVYDGALQIAALRRQAENRLTIMAGGGLTLTNLVQVVRTTGVDHLHGSLIRKQPNAPARAFPSDIHAAADLSPIGEVLLEDVERAIQLFREASSQCYSQQVS